MKIRTGVTGKILAGDEIEPCIKVVNDTDSTGDFLIFTPTSPEMTDGYDADYDALKNYFDESGWVVACS